MAETIATPDPDDPKDIEELLRRYWGGEKAVYSRLFERLIGPMRELAARRLAVRAKHYPMVQKTMIAIDAIKKLLDQIKPVQNLDQAMGLGKTITDRLIKDWERAEGCREAGELPSSSHLNHPAMPHLPPIDPIDVLECLRKLEGVSARAADVFRLRLLSGCSIDEAGEALGVSHATIERQYRFALDFMRKCLEDRGSSGGSSTSG